MRSPAGTDHWKRGIYREIVKPARIVFTFAWEDADGNPGHELLSDLGGAVARKLRAQGAIGVRIVAGADHTFTDEEARSVLVTALDDALSEIR